jgi:DNA end-binding protein Ku
MIGMANMRSIARTTISFGLVSVPVAVYKATGDERAFELHQFDAESGSRIRHRKVRESDGAEVEAQDIVKGAEVGDKVVMITEADFATLADLVPSARSMEVQSFVPASEVGAMALSGTSYYLGPDSKVKGSAKPYALLAGALERSGRLAVIVWGTRGREHPFVLHAENGVISARQMHWPSALRTPPAIEQVAVSATEEDLADGLVGALSAERMEIPESDQYGDALAALITAKAEGTEGSMVTPEAPLAPQNDIGALLAASLDALRQGRAA